MTEVALAAGFNSLRRFNEVFHGLFHRPPSALRRKSSASRRSVETGIVLRLRYRTPYDWESMLSFLEARAIQGIEVVEKGCYRRTIEIGGAVGNIAVTHLPLWQSLSVSLQFPTVQSLPEIINRVRRLFDLGADIETINEHLSHDPQLAPFVAQRPGLRAPGGWDGFELAVRAVLGQQISVVAARRLAGQLVALYGRPLPENSRNRQGSTHTFPIAECLANATTIKLGTPTSRQNTLIAVGQAATDDPNLFRPSGTIEEAIARLRVIPGIGEWTAQYIALRAIREMDAFPASDIGLLHGAAKIDGAPATPKSLLDRAEVWRPWRAYAAQHLWAANATR
jgi:AraC family transcriptional regulator, regulatory protein of adaptative response / DNA-3-methyladenine glycosylase II